MYNSFKTHVIQQNFTEFSALKFTVSILLPKGTKI